MKIELVDAEPTFVPVALQLSFQTQNELDAWYALLNHTVVCDFISQSTGEPQCGIIRNILQNRADRDSPHHSEFCKLLEKFYNVKEKLL